MCTRSECIERLKAASPYLKKEYGVESLCLFGSMARGDNRSDSDVDLLVEMPPRLFLIESLREYLENILSVSVDIVRRHSHLSARFLNEIAKDAITIL